MRRWLYAGRAVLLLAGLLGISLALLAQESSGRTIRGQVLDENEKVVAGALVHLTNLATKDRWSVATDKEGRYKFNDVSRKHDFEVMAESRERKSRARRLSQFDSRDIVFINLKLEPPKKSEDEEPKEEKKKDER